MKANPDKFHLLLSDTDCQGTKVCNEKIENFLCKKRLDIKFDTKLKFEEHVGILCKSASQKINALTRISSYKTFQQRKRILDSFVISHFSYCPIVWMFYSRRLDNRINNMHERALQIIYQNYTTSSTDLLAKDNSLTIHHRNLQKSVTEILKVKVGKTQEIKKGIFQVEDKPYKL